MDDFTGKINNNPVTEFLGINKTTIIAKGVNLAEELVRVYNLRNVSIIPQPKNRYQINQDVTIDPGYGISSLGTPVMSNLTFTGASYTDQYGFTQSFDNVYLETVLITLDQAKNIVKTPIQGRKGTVKEYIGMGDYQVKIDGILTSTNGVYPLSDVQALKNMLVAPMSIQVTSWYLQLFDIDYITIDSYSIAQHEGGYSQQPFSINALSDEDVQLIVQ